MEPLWEPLAISKAGCMGVDFRVSIPVSGEIFAPFQTGPGASYTIGIGSLSGGYAAGAYR
jgi:hypothetical protein